jgi:enamine deaminase RidA (YjgF/YER057c/UK114 family)
MGATLELDQLDLILPPVAEETANYVPWRMGGNMLFLSGVGPRRPSGITTVGKVGQALTIQEGYDAARLAGLNLIAHMKAALGSLDRVDTILKIYGMINAAPNFIEHSKVVDGCVDLFVEVFGARGRPARSGVGMGSLPGNISILIDGIVLVK